VAKPLALALALSALALLTPALASATANYVYHEQTTAIVGGTCGQYLTNPAPKATDTYPLEFKIEYQFYTDNAVVYYTTDGTSPSGSYGVPSGTTVALPAAYTCTFVDPIGGTLIEDTAAATLPAEPAGTTVNYIIGAWHTPTGSGGPEVFANSGTCGTCTMCMTSSCATVFTYTVASPDAGAEGGPKDAAVEAKADSGFDGGGGDAKLEAAVEAGADGKVDAGLDASLDATTDAASDAMLAETGSEAGADAPADAVTDTTVQGQDAASSHDGAPSQDANESFDAGPFSAGPQGCGCSSPGDSSGVAWGPFAFLAALVVAAALRVRRR